MEVHANNNTNGVDPVRFSRTAPRRPAEPTQDQTSFEGVNAVNRALEATPASRSEAVDRATGLIGDLTYPPRETIQRLSHLLALKLQE
ncbi:MAG: hypothetical protein IT580_13845 [Verrucomicrobiales bacterium]|nr:hypothetical protein [Verrucomicrobiales bacterium]